MITGSYIVPRASHRAVAATTIAAAVQMMAVTPAEFERVIVDTTVQEKAIA